jgi:hypothetical protein
MQAGAVFYTAWRMGLGDPADPCLRPKPISISGKQPNAILAAPGEGLLQETFWRQEANLWHEVASNDLQSLLAWEDGQFSFHLSLDEPKRPALAGR